MRRLYADLSDRGEINPASLNSDGVRLLGMVIQTVAPEGALMRPMSPVFGTVVSVPGDVVKVANAVHHATKRAVEVIATVGRLSASLSYEFTTAGNKRATLLVGFNWDPLPVRVKAMLSGDWQAMALCIVDTKWFITDALGAPVMSQRPIKLAEALYKTAEMR